MAGRKLSAGDLLLTCAQLIARGAYAIATPQADRKLLRKCVAAEKAVPIGSAADQVHGKGTSSILRSVYSSKRHSLHLTLHGAALPPRSHPLPALRLLPAAPRCAAAC
eukprot:scaffold70211_cov66-Phaeocystis_antarctica.AAC.2